LELIISKIFGKLYSLNYQSPKNKRELDEIASSLGIRLLNIGRILTVQWAASTKRSIDAVINNFAALSEHFSKTSKHEGLKKYCHNFVQNLCLIADALDELSDLSEFFQ
jgi:hypothetical protein